MWKYDNIYEKYLWKEWVDKSKIIEEKIKKEKNKPNIFTPFILLFKFDLWLYKLMLKFSLWVIIFCIPFGIFMIIWKWIDKSFSPKNEVINNYIPSPKEEINNNEEESEYEEIEEEQKKSEKDLFIEELKKSTWPQKGNFSKWIVRESSDFKNINWKNYYIYNFSYKYDNENYIKDKKKILYNIDYLKSEYIKFWRDLKNNNLNNTFVEGFLNLENKNDINNNIVNQTKSFIESFIKYNIYQKYNVYMDWELFITFDITPEELKNLDNLKESDFIKPKDFVIWRLNHDTNLRVNPWVDWEKIRILKKWEYIIYDRNYSENIWDNNWTLVKTPNNEEWYMITSTIDFVRKWNFFNNNEICKPNSYMENWNCVCFYWYDLIYDKNWELTCEKLNKWEISDNLAVWEVTFDTNLRDKPWTEWNVIRIIKKWEKVLYTHNYMRIKIWKNYWINVRTKDWEEWYMITDTVNFLHYYKELDN